MCRIELFFETRPKIATKKNEQKKDRTRNERSGRRGFAARQADFEMKLNRLFLFGTALSLAASGAGFAGGVAPANEPMVITTPSPAPAAVGYVELSFGTMTMQDENDGDFDGTPSSFSGQAFARLGENFALEIQS